MTEESSSETQVLRRRPKKNVACGVLVTEVHIGFIVFYIELVLCIEQSKLIKWCGGTDHCNLDLERHSVNCTFGETSDGGKIGRLQTDQDIGSLQRN
jgi:hypothetical protein